jgi:FkbM family methyltransferase
MMDVEQKKQIALFFASLPIPYRLWAAIETLACICQGKGWGASSVHHEVRAASDFLGSPPRCIVDVGANVGDYTQAWLDESRALVAEASIEFHLFEPSRVNANYLMTRFSGQPLIHLYPLALSDVSAVLPLYANVPGSALGSLSPRNLDFLSIDMSLHEDVRVERLDQLVASSAVRLSSATEIDVLKIDVEGHELSVLRGLGALISKVKLIQFEFNTASLDTHSTFFDFWRFLSSTASCSIASHPVVQCVSSDTVMLLRTNVSAIYLP